MFQGICHIARLRVEDKEEQEKREQDINKDEEQVGVQLDGEQQVWEQQKTNRRDKERRKMVAGSRRSEIRSRKRTEQEEGGGELEDRKEKIQPPQGGLVGNPRSSENCPKGAEQRAP